MNARFARVLAPLFLTLPVFSSAFCGAAHADTIPAASDFSKEDAPAPENAQLSLDVESAPIAQVFSLIEAMTLLRARYAAPPDAILTAHFDEEPLLPALEKMLDGTTWTAQLFGDSLFLNAPKNAHWKVWRGENAPHTSWNRAPEEREYSQTTVRLTSAPDAPSQLTAIISDGAPREKSPRIAAFSPQDVFWETAPLAFEARRVPGIGVAVGENEGAQNRRSEEKSNHESANANTVNAKNADFQNANIKSVRGENISLEEKDSAEKTASTRAVWMRCDFQLRVVPARLYLTIATPAAATLFLNGAPVWVNRSGQSRVEISQFVRRGANRVALLWKNAPPFSASEPLLRYEWQTELAP